MATTLSLFLTDELRAFIDEHCGDGKLYATPSEFVCDLLRQKIREVEAEKAAMLSSKAIKAPSQVASRRFAATFALC